MVDQTTETLAECLHTPDPGSMAPNILIRNVPMEVHQMLVARASSAGQSLQEYLLSLMGEITSRPTAAEIMAAVSASLLPDARGGMTGDDVVAIIHEGRREREDRTW